MWKSLWATYTVVSYSLFVKEIRLFDYSKIMQGCKFEPSELKTGTMNEFEGSLNTVRITSPFITFIYSSDIIVFVFVCLFFSYNNNYSQSWLAEFLTEFDKRSKHFRFGDDLHVILNTFSLNWVQ